MDNRKTKRPRGSKESVDLSTAPPKKRSKTKKSKRKSGDGDATVASSTVAQSKTSGSLGATHHSNSFETTATKDGQIMAQMLSTFSHLEQSRFRAFRRSALNTKAVQEWIAACLQQHYPETTNNSTNSVYRNHNGKTGSMTNLQDWSAPGQADSIAATAAVLAKIYAQRLVRTAIEIRDKAVAAKTVANDESNTDDYNNNNNNNNNNNGDKQAPLSPEYLRQAWEERTKQGLDPGFFLQESFNSVRVLSNPLVPFATRQTAALAAQEAYDAKQQKGNTHDNEDGNSLDQNNRDDEMDTINI